jgi:hypothetical protein
LSLTPSSFAPISFAPIAFRSNHRTIMCLRNWRILCSKNRITGSLHFRSNSLYKTTKSQSHCFRRSKQANPDANIHVFVALLSPYHAANPIRANRLHLISTLGNHFLPLHSILTFPSQSSHSTITWLRHWRILCSKSRIARPLRRTTEILNRKKN